MDDFNMDMDRAELDALFRSPSHGSSELTPGGNVAGVSVCESMNLLTMIQSNLQLLQTDLAAGSKPPPPGRDEEHLEMVQDCLLAVEHLADQIRGFRHLWCSAAGTTARGQRRAGLAHRQAR
jgi:hypothetical protein